MDEKTRLKHYNWINSSNYKTLLIRWRFTQLGDEIFEGELGEYYAAIIKIKRERLDPGEAVRISKEVGWDASKHLNWTLI